MVKKGKAPSEDELFHVEVITKARVVAVTDDEDEPPRKKSKKKSKEKANVNARWEYYVKWANYDSSSDSWEPEANVAGCQRLLASFWDHVGTDDNDYAIDYVVEASEDWIKREKIHFKTEFNDQQKRRVQREEDEKERSKKLRKKMKKTLKTHSRTASPPKRPKKKAPSLHMSEDSDDEVPLSHNSRKRKRRETASRVDTSSTKQKVVEDEPLAPVPDDDDEQSNQLHQDNTWTDALFSEPLSLEQPPGKEAPAQPAPAPPQAPAPAPSKPIPHPQIKLILRRPNDPHAKIADMEPQGMASSGISTKQRLAMGALAPTRPNEVPQPASGRGLPPARTNSLAALGTGFKKANDPTPVAGPSRSGSYSMGDVRATASPRVPPQQPSSLVTSNLPASPAAVFTQPLLASPIDVSMQEGRFDRPSAQSTVTKPSAQASRIHQAESFLQSIMPAGLAAPLTPTIESPREPAPPRALLPKRLIPPERILKKWSWSGGAYTESNPSEALCNITFCDVTDPLPNAMRFSVVLDSLDRLEFPTFHDIVDLPMILRTCADPPQFARVVPKESNDAENFRVFRTYMAKHQKLVLVPVSLDKVVVGHIIIFPEDQGLCNRLKVPPVVYAPRSQVHTFLVAALLPWSSSTTQMAKQHQYPPISYLPTKIALEPVLDQTRWERSLRGKPAYHHALHILRFPAALHKFMAEPNHLFDVWWEGGDGIKKRVGMETHMLFSIMEQCRAKRLTYEPRGAVDLRMASDSRVTNDPRINTEPRVIFVHVGAMKTLPQLPGLVDLCTKSYTQFWTYGTHRSIAPKHWGVREIYPCGGIITFTPDAFLEHYIDVLEKIEQIQTHPLWACYVMPSVLGMVARAVGEDPLAVFDSGQFPFHGIIDAIIDGSLALITAPPLLPASVDGYTLQQTWVRNHWTHHPQDARSILQFCTNAYKSQYGNKQKKDAASAIKSEIAKDVASMRQQPNLMTAYRRYVVIGNERKTHGRKDDGLEWTTTKKFDFKDGYFT